MCLRAAALVAAAFFSTAIAVRADETAYAVTIDFNVRAPMRDGVMLSADVYRPDAKGRFPVVLVRTPYNKNDPKHAGSGVWWASRGYAYVVQDVRGRGDSDGEFYPLRHEAKDGFDAQTWAGTQPWSSGKVGTMGGSYVGWTQVYTAGLDNPHLAAMAPRATAPDPMRNFPYQHGVLMLSTAPWLALVDGRMRQNLSAADLHGAHRGLPLETFDRRLGRNLPVWREWLLRATDREFWSELSYQEDLLKSTAPALYISGWYDDVLVGTTENFINMTRRAHKPSVRATQRLLIGPWGHATSAGRALGEIDFGAESVVDLDAIHKRWFDHWLRGMNNGVEREAPVRIFVMGANEWRDENEWPLARTQYVKYYLHSRGAANSLEGDGVLQPEPPGDQPPDRFRYDPRDPTPFITDLTGGQVGGPDDYRAVERRNDVLVYTSAPVAASTQICGPMTVRLFAATSARDTDWTAKVLDVHPGGYAQRLNDGIVRARFRRSMWQEAPIEPGQAYEYDIDVWSTCIELQAGHRIRLEIASSAFPKFDRNLNTGQPLFTETHSVVAEQTVFHEPGRASYLLLPIVPPKSHPRKLIETSPDREPQP